MTEVLISGCLDQKRGRSWETRYVIIVGLTLVYFECKQEFLEKKQPIGVIVLNKCELTPNAKDFSFTIVKNGKEKWKHSRTFVWKTSSRHRYKKWVKNIEMVMNECRTIIPEQKVISPKIQDTFGVYNTFSFLSKLQHEEIVYNFQASIDTDASSMVSTSVPTSNYDSDLPRFYAKCKYKYKQVKEEIEKNKKIQDEITAKLRKANNIVVKKRPSFSENILRLQINDNNKLGTERNSLSLTSSSSSLTSHSSKDSNASTSDFIRRQTIGQQDLFANIKDVNGHHRIGNNSSSDNEDINRDELICEERLFYSCGNEPKLVYAQLYPQVICQFADDDYHELIDKIVLSTITGVKSTEDNESFELHTIISDKIHVFGMYLCNNTGAKTWINYLVEKCGVQLICDSSEDDNDSSDRLLSGGIYGDYQLKNNTCEADDEADMNDELLLLSRNVGNDDDDYGCALCYILRKLFCCCGQRHRYSKNNGESKSDGSYSNESVILGDQFAF